MPSADRSLLIALLRARLATPASEQQRAQVEANRGESICTAVISDPSTYGLAPRSSFSVDLAVAVGGALATLRLILASSRKQRHARLASGAAALLAWVAAYWLARRKRDHTQRQQHSAAEDNQSAMRSTLQSEAATLLDWLDQHEHTEAVASTASTTTCDASAQTDGVWTAAPPHSLAPPPLPSVGSGLLPPPLPSSASMPPPPPPPPLPLSGIGSTRRAVGGMPSAADLMSGIAGLKRAEQREDGVGAGGAAVTKQARDLAGARPAGGVEISLAMLESVQLKASSAAEAPPKPREATPEMMKARSRLKRIERPRTPKLGSPLAAAARKGKKAINFNGEPSARKALGALNISSENIRRRLSEASATCGDADGPAVSRSQNDEEGTGLLTTESTEAEQSISGGGSSGGLRAGAWKFIWG